jgi:hypothetical protein
MARFSYSAVQKGSGTDASFGFVDAPTLMKARKQVAGILRDRKLYGNAPRNARYTVKLEQRNPARKRKHTKPGPKSRYVGQVKKLLYSPTIKQLEKQFPKNNPASVKGRKVKGGRAVTLHNFTGSIIRKSNGQVEIKGRGRKK